MNLLTRTSYFVGRRLISAVFFSPDEQRNEQMELFIRLDEARKRELMDDSTETAQEGPAYVVASAKGDC